ncbi:effector binding domain-containing protein [Paenibacillus sp. IB182496]|uniref:Effector binding domain-containing protein n=1 Tax=Paenibacillus sabuli TaxID=2772509 RepID=A0A927BY57_9BACL|nr:GyrI-like domain-containing protein [Paenibacillus sabuli]MBD2847895.1 effector binding domain-containing protein [Paenibacillus sabuli]
MDNCMLVSKPALHLVGISYSGPYSTIPDEAIRLQGEFQARKHELNDSVISNAIYSPYYGNEAFATYWACCAVRRQEQAPKGMVQFTIPERTYALVSCTNKRIGEGYEQIFSWMREHSLIKEEKAVAIEIYYVDEHLEEEQVELLIPVVQHDRTGSQ